MLTASPTLTQGPGPPGAPPPPRPPLSLPGSRSAPPRPARPSSSPTHRIGRPGHRGAVQPLTRRRAHSHGGPRSPARAQGRRRARPSGGSGASARSHRLETRPGRHLPRSRCCSCTKNRNRNSPRPPHAPRALACPPGRPAGTGGSGQRDCGLERATSGEGVGHALPPSRSGRGDHREGLWDREALGAGAPRRREEDRPWKGGPRPQPSALMRTVVVDRLHLGAVCSTFQSAWVVRFLLLLL